MLNMVRIARIIIPDIPHHIIQRGNRRQQTFFNKDDYLLYKKIMREFCRKHDISVWAYCLMPNHVHMILVPKTEDGIRLAVGEAHRRYTSLINKREQWKGHLWQGRFSSYPMDEKHLIVAARYIEQNPVRAKLVNKAEDWPWSSAYSHLNMKDDDLVSVQPLLDLVPDWQEFIDIDADGMDMLRSYERTGRPLGDVNFVKRCEKKINRVLQYQKRGPKIKNNR